MPDGHSLTEVARIAGVTPRTVRYYIGQGLLRPAARTGPGATYDDDQVRRLMLIRRLQRQHLPLAAIRSRLAELDPAEVSELLAEPEAEPATSSALEYIRQHLSAASTQTSPSTMATSTPASSPRSAMRYLAGIRRSPDASAEPRRAATPAFEPLLARPMVAAPAAAPPLGIRARQADEPAGEMRSTWDRIELTPDIEIHVRRPLDRRGNRIVDQILTFARDRLAAD